MQRSIRVVEYFDFSGVIPDSPVQVNEGFIISDTESHELFASFSFQNTSEKPIKSLDIRLFFYQTANVPYEKRSFTYSYDDMTLGIRKNAPTYKKHKLGRKQYASTVAIGESFGRYAYIRIPESYFRKIELEISKITFDDGSSVSPKLIVKNHYTPLSTLGDAELYAFSRLNIYTAAEERHPTKVVPQFGNSAWLCCCGHKNLASSGKCELCLRDRDWQKNAFSEKTISAKIDELKASNDYYRPDKTKFLAVKESDEDIQKKIAEYEKVMRRVAEQERKKEHDRKMIIPKILLFVGAMYAIVQICYYILITFHAAD